MAAGKPGRPPLRREVIVGAVAAYLRGDLLKHIAERFNVSQQVVINYATKAGFKPRKKRRRP
jgi:transposase